MKAPRTKNELDELSAKVGIDLSYAVDYLVRQGFPVDEAQSRAIYEQMRLRDEKRNKVRLRQVLYLVKNDIPYEIADRLDDVELAAHVDILKEMAHE